ncbi:hypothetical protein FSP39_018062 [Pinctada imbricata]|uniref:snRNA-activating protein complex subunit 1 n=1 Tax=Pinctada imbricata TaxID=66713 RepID=A0AA88YUA8_PINIB|nr:hypothetical protein FSP39_018062 [Pinctada imbricata]
MGRTRVEPPANVTAGVRSDFEQLLQRFTDTETVRYENFAAIWRDMKMTFLFAGRLNDRETREFTEDCLHIALQYYLPPYNFQVRVGGLYLLYGLYMTQPLVVKAKIRVTPEKWDSIVEFQGEAHRQEHLDVDYVFHKLRVVRAFLFCATPTEAVILEKPSVGDEATESDQFKEEQSILYTLFSTDVLEQMAAVHHNYHKVKVGMEGEDAQNPAKSLDVINKELIPTVTKAIVHYQMKRKAANSSQKKSGFTDDEEDPNDPDYNIYDTKEDIGGRSKKKRLKAKAFQNVAETKSARQRKRLKKEESTSGEEVTTPSKKRKATAKENIYEADEMSKEFQTQGQTSEQTSSQLLSMPVLDIVDDVQDKSPPPPKKGGKTKGKKTPDSDTQPIKPVSVTKNSKAGKGKKIKEEKLTSETVKSDGEEGNVKPVKIRKGKGGSSYRVKPVKVKQETTEASGDTVKEKSAEKNKGKVMFIGDIYIYTQGEVNSQC